MNRLVACCVLLGLALPTAAADEPSFRFAKEIERGSAPKESILAVTLDSDVYAATRAGFPDLRVFNAQNKEVPYVKLSESQQTVEYKVAGWCAEEDAAGKLTVIHVTTRREPLSEMTLETTSRNFSRSAAVQVPVTRGVRTEWIEVGRGQVSLVDFGGYHKETLKISFPEQRESEYRIVIHNEDNPPLEVTGVTARGSVYRAIFLAAENETYRLGYGSEEAESPRYDAAVVLARLRQGRAPSEAKLGKETANPAAGRSPLFDGRSLINNAAFLISVVLVLVVLLGWALFRAVRRINELPKDS